MNVAENYDVQKYLDILEGGDSDAIRSVAFEVGELGILEAVPILSVHLKSTNVGIQEAAEYALRKLRGSEVIRKMFPLLHSEDSSLRNLAMDILREIGCDDVTALTPLLRNPDPDIRIFISDILGHTKSILAVAPLCEALLKDPEVNVRYQAAMSLGRLGFSEAVGALRQAMRDEEWVQFSVVEALMKIRADDTIDTLIQSLDTASPLVTSVIIDALGEIKNVKAVPLLLKFMNNAPLILRHRVVKTIVQILGAESLCLIPESEQENFRLNLEHALDDDDDDIQLLALEGLSVFGNAESSKLIMDFLTRISKKTESDLYTTAIRALAGIGYNGTFASFFNPKNPVIARIAISACLQMHSEECVEILQDIFWDLDRDSQRLAMQYMEKNSQEENAPFLLDVLQNSYDEEVIKSAIYCLGVRLQYIQAQDIIFSYLEHEDIREKALEACIVLRTSHLERKFVDWAKHGDEQQRMMAIYALGLFAFFQYYSIIVNALTDESEWVRQLAVEAFGHSATNLREHLDVLLPMFDDPSAEVRTSLLEVLSNLKDIVLDPYLLLSLEDEDEWVCIRAIEALQNRRHPDLLSLLLNKMESASDMVMLKIIEVLVDIGGDNAFNILLDLMQHPLPHVREAAREAITKIKAG